MFASEIAWKRTQELLREQGLSNALAMYSDELRKSVNRWVNNVIARTNFRRGSLEDRLKTVQATLFELTTDAPLSALIARWMGVPPPGALASPTGGEVPWEQINAPGAVKYTAPSTRGPRIESLVVKQEKGGTGAGNGQTDPGEWIHLQVNLFNDSPDPWFSTSAFLMTPKNACILAPGNEFELNEMDPHNGTALYFWVYFSHECNAASNRTLFIDLKDTHHPGKRRLKLSFDMPDKGIPAPTVVDTVLDADFPGSSDGSMSQTASPDLHLEFSHGVRAGSSRTLGARIRYTVPGDQKDAIASWRHRHPDMLPKGGRRFAPGDDVDLLMEDETTIRRVQKNYRESRRWFPRDSQQGTLWVAADLETWQAINGLKSRRTTPTAVTGSQLPSAGALVTLLLEHTRFVSREAKPIHDNGIAAVAGHDLVVDVEEFEAAYNSLTSAAGHASATGGGASNSAASRYLHRIYIPIPMPHFTKQVAKPAPRKPRPRRVVKPKVPSKPYEPFTRVDLGVGATFFSNIQPEFNEVWSDKGTLSLSFEGRISLGRAFTGILQVHSGSGEPAGIYEKIQFEEAALGLGIGYIIPLGSSLEIHPRALFSTSTRRVDSADLFGTEEKAYGVEPGITLRYWFTSWLGAHLDAAYLLTNDAPSYGENDLIKGIAPRLSGGLSTFF